MTEESADGETCEHSYRAAKRLPLQAQITSVCTNKIQRNFYQLSSS